MFFSFNFLKIIKQILFQFILLLGIMLINNNRIGIMLYNTILKLLEE